MFDDKLPNRVRVLILGGGIHGSGLLHDFASRGWTDVHLVEKNSLGSGTSSRSTKLIHGGLRYLQRPSQFPMVSESLRERRTLLDIVPDLVKPLEFLIPLKTHVGPNPLVLQAGLFLYDFLAGKQKVNKFKRIPKSQWAGLVPQMEFEKFRALYSYWDAQTDDLELVNRVAASAKKLGVTVSEHTEVVSIQKDEDGWKVDVKAVDGSIQTISALYVLNCLGPWANDIITKSSLKPTHKALNDKGSHIIVDDLGFQSAFLLNSHQDSRISFIVPWQGKTLIGTTENHFTGEPGTEKATEEEIQYLLDRTNIYLKKKLIEKDVLQSFAGLRWLAVEEEQDISGTSRECIIGEIRSQRGAMLTIYGGKLTSYRSLCEKIGDKIVSEFGEYKPSNTNLKSYWIDPSEAKYSIPNIIERFN